MNTTMIYNMKKLGLVSAFLVALIAAPQTMPFSGPAIAHAEVSFEAKMNAIEDRARMLKLVIRKLKKEFIGAKMNMEAMKQKGMDPKDIERIERAFNHKVNKLIERTLKEISEI